MSTPCHLPTTVADSPPRVDDETLLAEYMATGSHEVFERLVQRFECDIFNYLRAYLGDQQQAEDAFQATFLQLHLKCHRFEPGRRLRPWLYAVAKNQAIDLLRRNRRHKAVSSNGSQPDGNSDQERQSLEDLLEAHEASCETRIEAAEDRQRLQSVVQTIPKRFQQAIILVFYEGLKYRQAADLLGIPLGTLKSRLHHALQHLRKALTPTSRAACC